MYFIFGVQNTYTLSFVIGDVAVDFIWLVRGTETIKKIVIVCGDVIIALYVFITNPLWPLTLAYQFT